MTPIELVECLNSKGVRLTLDEGALIVDSPEGALDEKMWQILAEQKPAMLPFLAHGWEVGWRAAAMMPHIPDRGPIPFLVARPGVETGPGQCHSCGEAMERDKGYVCSFCSRATNLALEMAMKSG